MSYSSAIVSLIFRFIAVTSRMSPLYMLSSQSFKFSSHCLTATLQPSGPRGIASIVAPGMGGLFLTLPLVFRPCEVDGGSGGGGSGSGCVSAGGTGMLEKQLGLKLMVFASRVILSLA